MVNGEMTGICESGESLRADPSRPADPPAIQKTAKVDLV